MAEADKPIYLYPVRAENEKLKAQVADLGAKVRFDRDIGAYRLDTEGLAAEKTSAILSKLAPFHGKEAEARWKEDRQVALAEKNALRSAAASRRETTKERKPEQNVAVEKKWEKAILVYPAHSQRDEFKQIVIQSQSQSKYFQANANREAHFRVITEVPERFEKFMGAEAKERFAREHAEMGGKPQQLNTSLERVRDEARQRQGAAFMAAYKDRGFLLADSERNRDNYARQLASMRDASTPQLLAVIRTTRERLQVLVDKELALRSEASGIPVEQLKELSFEDQRRAAVVDGKMVNLPPEEFMVKLQLARGIAAINNELEARNVGVQKDRVRGQEQAVGAEQSIGAEKPKSTAKGASRSVSEGQSVDDVYEHMRNRRRGFGR